MTEKLARMDGCEPGGLPDGQFLVAESELTVARGVLTSHLFVAAAHRRQRIATASVEAAVAVALERGAGQLALAVHRCNAGAQAFWRAIGFVETDYVGFNRDLKGGAGRAT